MDKRAEADKMVVIGCCSTGSASGGHQAGTPPLLEPALQQSIKTILFVSAYLSASAASLVQGRWIYHKSTGPIGEWSRGASSKCAQKSPDSELVVPQAGGGGEVVLGHLAEEGELIVFSVNHVLSKFSKRLVYQIAH